METKAPARYYTDLGRAHDYLLRCKDCQRLVTHDKLTASKGCPTCGNRRVAEIEALSLWEWLKIRIGLIRFGDRDRFLKEFRLAR